MSELAYENCYGVINNHIIGKSTVDNRNLALVYDPDSVYNKGDHCIHGMKYWVCTADNTTGTWNATKWTQTRAGDELSGLSGDVLWENNGASTVASTSFTVDLSKYKSLKLITQDGVCECATSGAASLSGCVASMWYSSTAGKTVGYVRFLNVTPSTGTVNISACTSFDAGTTSNTRILPIKVIGYR